jgi:acyl-CoA reductase-like NAD-dependent aldehyde dehydrogenase
MTHVFTAISNAVSDLTNSPSTTTLSTLSPITGQVIVERPYPSSNDVEQAVQTAHSSYKSWKNVPLAERKRIVTAGVEHLAGRALELGPELTAQMGRPAKYTASEFASFKDRASWLINKAEKALGDENVDEGRPEGFKRIIRRAPVGVCLLVGAWNACPFFPFSHSDFSSLFSPSTVPLHDHR